MNENGCFINFTNHPSRFWSKEQYSEALKYGNVIKDIPFPNVSASAGEGEIFQLAQKYAKEIGEESPSAVLCQGEFTLAYQVITILARSDILVMAACSERLVQEEHADDKTVKHAEYKFVRFRKYHVE